MLPETVDTDHVSFSEYIEVIDQFFHDQWP